MVVERGVSNFPLSGGLTSYSCTMFAHVNVTPSSRVLFSLLHFEIKKKLASRLSQSQPDRPFHILRLWKSGDRRMVCSWGVLQSCERVRREARQFEKKKEKSFGRKSHFLGDLCKPLQLRNRTTNVAKVFLSLPLSSRHIGNHFSTTLLYFVQCFILSGERRLYLWRLKQQRKDKEEGGKERLEERFKINNIFFSLSLLELSEINIKHFGGSKYERSIFVAGSTSSSSISLASYHLFIGRVYAEKKGKRLFFRILNSDGNNNEDDDDDDTMHGNLRFIRSSSS